MSRNEIRNGQNVFKLCELREVDDFEESPVIGITIDMRLTSTNCQCLMTVNYYSERTGKRKFTN